MKQFITEAQRLQKLAGISEIKIIPSNKVSVIKKMIATNFPQVIKRGNLRGASNEYFPILLAVAKMNGFDFDSEDDLIAYINDHSDQKEEVEKLIDGFKDALDDLNVDVTVNEIKILPSTPQLSRDTLIDKLIDLYVDLYDDESDSLLDILSKYIPDRIFYNSNLSYKEIFKILDNDDLLKLYNELSRLK